MVNNNNNEAFVKQALEKQFRLAGYTVESVESLMKKEQWRKLHCMTEAQKEIFKSWFVSEAGKQLFIGKSNAEKEFEAFCDEFGLISMIGKV